MEGLSDRVDEVCVPNGTEWHREWHLGLVFADAHLAVSEPLFLMPPKLLIISIAAPMLMAASAMLKAGQG